MRVNQVVLSQPYQSAKQKARSVTISNQVAFSGGADVFKRFTNWARTEDGKDNLVGWPALTLILIGSGFLGDMMQKNTTSNWGWAASFLAAGFALLFTRCKFSR